MTTSETELTQRSPSKRPDAYVAELALIIAFAVAMVAVIAVLLHRNDQRH